MDQNRPDNSSQQQNVHLHMHQVVCGCHGGIYPAPAYYQPVSFRTPAPPMVAYNPQQLARPYLQHYQYTQFNQYSMPVPQVTGGAAASVYSSNNQAEIIFGTTGRDRRERLEVQEEVLEAEKPSESSGYDHGHVSPPPTKESLNGNLDDNTPENFVKFLERSCLTAEQIAHRNRNRPCFRNIQNLCVRTRSEILKPCTTVSNIHSQGIPWATKDFIYAFVRLTNCWHILRGYWENRDGPAIGKITRELTPEFRECYVRWEKETMDLAAQLTKVFYNLDTNINSPLHTGSVHAANNLVPPQVQYQQINLMKNPEFSKTVDSVTSAAATVQTSVMSSKNSRGLLHLPSSTETVDQGNQTCSGDFFPKSAEIAAECPIIENEEEEETSKIYMKPGSYKVPKRTVANNTETTLMNAGSPRTIEFLETAQNVNKVMEAASDRYWANKHSKKVIAKPVKEDAEAPEFNVQNWLVSSRFSDYDNASTGSCSPPNIGAYYIDAPLTAYGDQQDSESSSQKPGTFTLLQREKTSLISTPKGCINGRSDIGVGLRSRKNDLKKSFKSTYEDKLGGLTETAVQMLEKIIAELKSTEFADYISQVKTEDHLPASNLDWILNKLKTNQYQFVNEVIRDLYYVVNFTSIYYGNFLDMDSKIDTFVQRIQSMLETRFNHFDFSTINGHKDELVGPLKLKMSKLDGNGDRLS